MIRQRTRLHKKNHYHVIDLLLTFNSKKKQPIITILFWVDVHRYLVRGVSDV